LKIRLAINCRCVDVTAGTGPVATYLIGTDHGTELGSRAPGFANVVGGDCSGLS
tara:strand:- start:1160 stop:1321 length:162 start_codon:yes stop_codon:yes gene_type:complete